MDDKKKVIGVSIIAGLLCIGVVTGVSVASAVSPNVKETMTLTEKEYKSNGTFSVEDLKWSEDVSKYNPRFADGMTSITYKANGEYMETVVLNLGERERKYGVVVKVEGVVEPTTTVTTTVVPTTTKPTVTTTAVPTTTAKTTVKTTAVPKTTAKPTVKTIAKKTTAKKTTAKTTAKKTTSTTKKKVVSTTKAVEDVPILSDEEVEELDRQHPNHPDNIDLSGDEHHW